MEGEMAVGCAMKKPWQNEWAGFIARRGNKSSMTDRINLRGGRQAHIAPLTSSVLLDAHNAAQR